MGALFPANRSVAFGWQFLTVVIVPARFTSHLGAPAVGVTLRREMVQQCFHLTPV